MAYSQTERADAMIKVIAGLRRGTPLTVLCSEDGMPCDDTVRSWADNDQAIARDIARAREAGFDALAQQALDIADEVSRDTIKGKDGQEQANSEWITRSRLRVETRLKLLAKWDPKRYGERIDVTTGGEKMTMDSTAMAVRAAALISMGLEQADAGGD